MERFSKFRKSKKDSAGATGIINPDDRDRSTSRTPSPGAQTILIPPPDHRRREKHSPFRGLHFRSSAKRARSSPPAALPQSPTAAVHHHPHGRENHELGSDREHATSSPLSTVHHPTTAAAVTPSTTQEKLVWQREDRNGPKIPSFLQLSPQDIEAKFQELIWLERERLMMSINNPSPSFKWARIPSHIKRLDRYMNIQPWHNNRVKLQVPPGKVDYINASPISLSTAAHDGTDARPSRYIAMQGPKKNSAEHVWRMVVEQLRSPAVIVMLTETHDGSTEKCYPYFPRSPQDPPLEVGETDEFSDGFRASVRCEEIEPTPAGDAIELRKLVVCVHRRARKTDPAAGLNGNANKDGPVSDAGHDSAVSSTSSEAEGEGDESQEDENDDESGDDDDDDMMIMSPAKIAPAGLDNIGFPPRPRIQTWGPVRQDNKETRSQHTVKEDQASQTASRPASEHTDDEQHVEPEGQTEMEEEKAVEEERIVYHFLYKKWPDFGVPNLEDLDSFFALMRMSREKNADMDNPRVVHCSAGVGRSGTFIALEHLMRELDSGLLEKYDDRPRTLRRAVSGDAEHQKKDNMALGGGNNKAGQSSDVPAGTSAPPVMEEDEEEGDDDDDLIFNTVNQLREQRRTMVQAENQFLFIYQVLRKLWQDKYGIPEEEQEPAAKRLEVDPFLGH